MNLASMTITGTKCVVVHGPASATPGKSETLEQLALRACKDVSNVDMTQIEANARTGNLKLGFTGEYFPKSNEITGPDRSILNFKKSQCHVRIYEALLEAGIQHGRITFNTGYMDANNKWRGNLAIYLNKTSIVPGTPAAAEKTLSQLKQEWASLEDMGNYGNFNAWKALADGDEDFLKGMLQKAIKSLKNTEISQAITTVLTAQEITTVLTATEPPAPEAGSDDEVPTTENL